MNAKTPSAVSVEANLTIWAKLVMNMNDIKKFKSVSIAMKRLARMLIILREKMFVKLQTALLWLRSHVSRNMTVGTDVEDLWEKKNACRA